MMAKRATRANKPHVKFTAEKKQKATEMISAGKTNGEITAATGLAQSTISRFRNHGSDYNASGHRPEYDGPVAVVAGTLFKLNSEVSHLAAIQAVLDELPKGSRARVLSFLTATNAGPAP
jgi:hypothetical protein